MTFEVSDLACLESPRRPMILTALNCAARTFKGNVHIQGNAEAKKHLVAFIESCGVTDFYDPKLIARRAKTHEWPVISFSNSPGHNKTIQPWADGWSFGLGRGTNTSIVHPAAAIAAGALSVGEAFAILRQDHPYAGRRSVSLSLWYPSNDPLSVAIESSPTLPDLWLVGLGHLGQAYAWVIAMAEYAVTKIHLQDYDAVEHSNLSTSMLAKRESVGVAKTELAGDWLTSHGFSVTKHDEALRASQRYKGEGSMVALFGVDNPSARRVMEKVGFDFIVDSGLGTGVSDFQGLRIRSFPGPAQASRIWVNPLQPDVGVVKAPAYQTLLKMGADPCGVTTLATRAVGAPFVGCYAAAHVLALVEQYALGMPVPYLIDTHLRSPEQVNIAFDD